jgi:hypothetical protein
MTDFNYKKYLTENKLTQTTKLRAGILAEGQFSWMTQDTGQQIGSQEENMIPVYMFDDKGKYYYESNYDGYGEFGGVDYYELLDKMNGGDGDRSRGIDLAFEKIKTDSEILYPALVAKPREFDYKTHDFTQQPKNDPNQSWYMEPEEEDYNGEDDYSNDYDENSGDGYIDDTDSEYDTGVDEGKKKYYKDAEADDAEHIDALEKDMKDDKKSSKIKENSDSMKFDTLYDFVDQKMVEGDDKAEALLKSKPSYDDLYDFVDQKMVEGDDEAEALLNKINKVNENKSSKMKMSELKAKIKEMALAEMNINEDTFAPESEEDFLAEVDRILAEADEVAVDDTEVAVDGEENVDVDTTIQVDPNVKAVQDALTQAQAAAQKLGDPKLTDQIGNTITFFTRAHVVEKGAVAESDEMEEGEKTLMNEVEGKLVDEKTGEEVTLPYETLDFRGDKMTVISFRAPHKPSSTGRIYTKGGGEYFPSVAGLKIIDHSFSEDLNESMFPMLKRILK